MNISVSLESSGPRDHYFVSRVVSGACAILAGFAEPMGRVLTKSREGHAAIPGTTIDDHLLKDIGVTRLGVRESALAAHNELQRPTVSEGPS